MAKKKTTQAETPAVVFSLLLGNQTFEGKGATLTEALRNTPKPSWIKGKGTVTITAGDKKLTQTMFPVRLKRLFLPAFQHIHANILARALR